MKITKSWIEKWEPCEEAVEWLKAQDTKDVFVLIERLRKSDVPDKYEWLVWAIPRLLKRKVDRVRFAVFAAELALPNFEAEYPNDNRPRLAIEAAKKYIKTPNKENKDAAWCAARAAWGAVRAAWCAVRAAWSAESESVSVARAAWSAVDAAWSAESAAWGAAASESVSETSAVESAARNAAKSAENAAWSAENAAESAARAAWSAAWAAASVSSAVDAAERIIDHGFKLLQAQASVSNHRHVYKKAKRKTQGE